MLQLSKFSINTLKTRPTGSDNLSTGILLQGGYIRQEMAGVYNFLPIWLRVLRKIENIVREEMDAAGYHETLMAILWPKESWDITGRWNIDVLFHVPAHGEKEYSINPTNEETVVPMMKEFLQSYKDYPTCVYHIQKKFRNEKRAKSGLLRGREFIMKDAYSFHTDDAEFLEFYENAKKVYMRIFERLGIGSDTYICVADGGDFTDKYSHEFQTVLPIGEDEIYICSGCKLWHNKEVVEGEFVCTSCKSTEYELKSASEVGNIFPLETKFSKAFELSYLDGENKMIERVLMGCYGIGISRLMGVIAEYAMTENGIAWPDSIAPASHYIIVIGEENVEVAKQLAQKLESEWKEVILDDRMGRKDGFGQKAADCELWGIPNRIVVSPKTLEQGGYEFTKRGEESKIIKL